MGIYLPGADSHCPACNEELSPVAQVDLPDPPGTMVTYEPYWFVCCEAVECSCGRNYKIDDFDCDLQDMNENVGWPYAQGNTKCASCRYYATEDCRPLVAAVLDYSSTSPELEPCDQYVPDLSD